MCNSLHPSLLWSERRKIKSSPIRHWWWLCMKEALKCFFKCLINATSIPTTVPSVSEEIRCIPVLGEKYSNERDNLKWANEGNTNYGILYVLHFLKHSRLFINSRPLHILLPWPGIFFPSILSWLLHILSLLFQRGLT